MQLEIKNLHKEYENGVKAIDNLSLTVQKGMFGLLGPNGAGKSSLMRTIATLQNPDSGKLFFDEIDILNEQMKLRKILGYLPQDFGVYPKVSANDLLDYFARLKGIAIDSERKSIVNEVLELTNLSDARKKNVDSFSGGMRQRFGIAQLLLNRPKLIIVDEPTAGLDPAERRRFLNILREIGSDNIVIFSTHIVDDVRELCNDMAILTHGKIQLQGTPSKIVDKYNGKIWTKIISALELESVQSKFKVISSTYTDDNRIILRIFADEKPDAECIVAAANLEDVYFIELQKKQEN